jgi:outer membrane assembly lipoprotein YfiO
MALTKGPLCDKFFGMRSILLLVLLLLSTLITSSAQAFWVWTPETNTWINPKYVVKDTPQEQLDYALQFYQAKSYEEAERELKKLLKHYPRARQAPEAQYYLGVILDDQERLFEAFKEYQIAIDKYPFSELSASIVKQQYAIGNRLLEGVKNKSFWRTTFASADTTVVDIFRTVIKNAPYGDLAPSAQYKIGLYLMEKELYQDAREEFERVLNDYPNSEWIKPAKYQIAVTDSLRSTDAQYDQKVTEAAVQEFSEFLEEYSDAELSKEAKDQIRQLKEKEAENNFVIAEFYEKSENSQSAKIYYQIVIDDYRQTSWSKKALEKLQAMKK